MSNSFNISVAAEIAALDAKIDIIDTEVDSIRSADIPGVDTKIDTIDTEVGVIDGIVDAIKTKTDDIPQLVRGHFTLYAARTASGTYVDVCNITGSGNLAFIAVACCDAGDTLDLKITVDSVASAGVTHTGDLVSMNVFFYGGSDGAVTFYFNLIPSSGLAVPTLNINFDTSLLIQIKRSAGAGSDVFAQAGVSLDSF